MAHLRSAYPFHADAGFGDRGVFMGANVSGGLSAFYFDPFEFYAARHLTNPNMIVMGSVGFGKSATVKALIRRLRAVYGDQRYLAMWDVNGIVPAPSSEVVDGNRVLWEFEPPAGSTLTVVYDGRIEPSRQTSQHGVVELLDGDTVVASVEFTTRVMP